MQNGLQVLSVINQFRKVKAAALDDPGLFGGEAELGEMWREGVDVTRINPCSILWLPRGPLLCEMALLLAGSATGNSTYMAF